MELQKLSSVRELQLQHEVYQPQKEQSDFKALMEQTAKSSSLQFSKHATTRMNERGITLTPQLSGDLEAAVEKARAKGSKDVVVIGSDSAFIVNVNNNTVITTMNAQEMKNNIFTNIDSAVLI